VDKALLKDLLSRLNKYAFQAFVFEMIGVLSDEYHVEPAAELSDVIYYKETSLSTYYGAYLTHFLPIELLETPNHLNVEDDEITRKLESIRKHAEKLLHEIYNPLYVLTQDYSPLQEIIFLNNFSDSIQKYQDIIEGKYRQLTNKILPFVEVHAHGINTFVEQRPSETERALKAYLQSSKEGFCITLSKNGVSVNRISSEKPVFSGVARQSLHPYETIYVYTSPRDELLLNEFAALINRNAKEYELEEFLRAYYKDIFGEKYDRIETQLWLRFPELDIAGKDRRLDIFLRNSVSSDWELFEVKRAVHLTRTYRDIPVITAEVLYSVQQVQNYARILSQDAVKRKFAAEGIEYFEPVLKLVIGRRPQISHQQWRTLVSSNERDVKLITFDDLIKEMAIRFKDRYLIA
jgi:hypothetical protein